MQNSYTDDELAGAQACVEFEQYVLMTCSVPLLKFASTVPVNCTIEQTTFVVSFYIVKTMAYKLLASKNHWLQVSALTAIIYSVHILVMHAS